MKEAATALWASLVRTLVPIIVGAVLGWLTTRGLTLDDQFEAALTAVLTAVFAFVWYLLVRLAETYLSPAIGWLLGLAKSPDSYSPDTPGKHVAAGDSEDDQSDAQDV